MINTAQAQDVAAAASDTVANVAGPLASLMENGMKFIWDFGPKIVGAIVVWIIGKFIINKVVGFVGKRIDNSKVDATLAPFIKNTIRFSCMALLAITTIGILGVQTASFAGILAASTLAIGMAFQGSLGNLAGGVLLLVFRPFDVGDVIKAQGFEGEVQDLLLFVTKLKTLDNRVIYIPNGALSSGPIENYSREEWRRVDMDFKVGAGQDVDAARKAMLAALNGVKGVTSSPAAQVAVTGLTEYATQLQARPFCKPADYYNVWVDCQEAVKKALVSNNIQGPVPSQNLFMHNTK